MFIASRRKNCDDAHSFCGLKDKKYPDKRTMGYPFDRNIKNANSLDDFAKGYSNMLSDEITIKFTNELKPTVGTLQ